MIDLTAYAAGLAAGMDFANDEVSAPPENPYNEGTQAFKDWYEGFNEGVNTDA